MTEIFSVSKRDRAGGVSSFEGEMSWSNNAWSYDSLNATTEKNVTLHQTEQVITDATCTSLSSPSNTDDKDVLQASAPRRKGKKRHALRFDPINLQQQHDVHFNKNNSGRKVKAQSAHQYDCNICRQSFSIPFSWSRHEEGFHWHTDTLWICFMRRLLSERGVSSALISSSTSITLRSMTSGSAVLITAFLAKICPSNTYSRYISRILMRPHAGDSVSLSWVKPIEDEDAVPNALWCGFCMLEFGSVMDRMKHVKSHFKAGSSIERWLAREMVGIKYWIVTFNVDDAIYSHYDHVTPCVSTVRMWRSTGRMISPRQYAIEYPDELWLCEQSSLVVASINELKTFPICHPWDDSLLRQQPVRHDIDERIDKNEARLIHYYLIPRYACIKVRDSFTSIASQV